MSIKEDLAYLLQILKEKEHIVLSPDLRIILLDTLSAYENLFYELEKWKSNYQSLEKELYVRGQRCTKFHITDRARKDQYIRFVCEYKCGICSEKLLYDKYLERYDSDKFLCDICLKTHHIASGVYHCKHCKFDVCNNCPDFLNVQQQRVCQKCGYQIYHVHSLPDPINGKYTCFLCDNECLDYNGVFACENCEFFMCPSCEKDLRKKHLFTKLKNNSRNATPEKKQDFEYLSPQKKSPAKSLVEKVKKGGLQLDNLDMKINANEPSHFILKEEDFMTFSGKRNPIGHDKSLDELAERPKIEEAMIVNQPLQAERLTFEMIPMKNESFTFKNEGTGDFHLKSEIDLFPALKLPENEPKPLDYHDLLPWDPKYAELFRKI